MQAVFAWVEDHRKVLVSALFVVTLLIGLRAYPDYGISWDESVHREYGIATYEYITQGDQAMLNLHKMRYYGPVFDLLTVVVEKMLRLEDVRQIYLARHLESFLVFMGGLFFFYLLSKELLGSSSLGLLGCVLLLLSPQIFAHAFFNPKDLPFLSFFIVGIYTHTKFIEKKNFSQAALHALSCALLIDIRVVGILIPLFTTLFFALSLLQSVYQRRRAAIRNAAMSFLVYVLLLVVLVILFWPFLWSAPLAHFVESFNTMRQFPWVVENLYLGKMVPSTALPWHYVPLWIAVSTPALYTVFFLLGVGDTLAAFLRTSHRDEMTQNLLLLLWFFLPLLAVIVLRSTLYDAWRQLFFIYPAFLLFSLKGIRISFSLLASFLHGQRLCVATGVLAASILLNLTNTAFFMVRNHPYQHVYFSALVGGVRGAEGKFDLDYWGLSYREALENILERDPSPTIRVYATTVVGPHNVFILPASERGRLQFTEAQQADYLLLHRRWIEGVFPEGDFTSVEVDGVKIMIVYVVIPSQNEPI